MKEEPKKEALVEKEFPVDTPPNIIQEALKKVGLKAVGTRQVIIVTCEREVPEPPTTSQTEHIGWRECHCGCHTNSHFRHCTPCCSECQICHMNISGNMADHIHQCHPECSGFINP